MLRSLSLKERKDLVLDGLNLQGPKNEDPIPAEKEFLDGVRQWSERRASKGWEVEPEAAVLYEVLRAVLEPSPEIQKLLQAIDQDRIPEVSEAEELWLLNLGRKLAGWP